MRSQTSLITDSVKKIIGFRPFKWVDLSYKTAIFVLQKHRICLTKQPYLSYKNAVFVLQMIDLWVQDMALFATYANWQFTKFDSVALPNFEYLQDFAKKQSVKTERLTATKKTLAESEVRKVTGDADDWRLSCAWMMESAISKTKR